jgi:hypothetical protein
VSIQDLTAENVLVWLETLNWEQRNEFFEHLRERYCLECGSDDPGCRCWDDD